MTTLVEIAKFGPKMEALGPGLVYHGTTWKAAKGIKKHGLKPKGFDTTVSVSPRLEEAAYYASRRSGGKRGRVFVYKPTAPPKRVVSPDEILAYDPADLGKPVHVQNTKKTTDLRLAERRKGIPPRGPRKY